ncbi:MAG: hypothetical protein ACD_79C00020G0006 [uncultured bacterium]|nr:MAG: hypothetical protein ACD_79C00020G0006 [uncultured bacterium]
MAKIKRALISVSDKTHLISFCDFLKKMDVEIISTGGTAKTLEENGIKIKSISDFTGFPEMLDGRVKTLHPKVHGGILGIRDNPEHIKTMEEHGIEPIDLVVVNLYPFEQVASNPNSTFEEVIENIDIGGPSMVRSASKNFRFVGIVTHHSQYNKVMQDLQENNGELSLELKRQLALDAFTLTSKYDGCISSYLKHGKLDSGDFPQHMKIEMEKIQDLRYGENPHQQAAFYKAGYEVSEPSLVNAAKIQGKELSFNNILDFDGALECVKEFDDKTCVIVKHTNPCGVANGNSCLNALERAWGCDPVSAFGSVIAFNCEVDALTANILKQYFIEGIIAPDFSPEAREILQDKKNIRLLVLPSLNEWAQSRHKQELRDRIDLKKVTGGFLMQTKNLQIETAKNFEVVTKKAPTPEELSDLEFCWKVVKHVKSNAIVYAKNKMTVGIGAGQMSRVDSSKIGALKAQKNLKSSVMASDAFFPFKDSIDEAHSYGISAIVQPGGSIRDREVIDACDEYGIAMVITKVRHFRH